MTIAIQNKWHKELTQEKWNTYSQMQQILMIGSEFSRAKNFIIEKNDLETGNCYERAMELVDHAINDPVWKNHLKELLYFREYLSELYLNERSNLEESLNMFKALLLWSPETQFVEI